MKQPIQFENREQFHKWLLEHHTSKEGIWLLFGKAKGPKTLKASEALEEALCFGWIDGQMQRIDDVSYQKYFCQRRSGSNWSLKNKKLVEQLMQQGNMKEPGLAKVMEAKQTGKWEEEKQPSITEEHIQFIEALLQEHVVAYRNFKAMSPSIRKTYTRAYLDAKTELGKAKRLAWMIDRLNQNLKPM